VSQTAIVLLLGGLLLVVGGVAWWAASRLRREVLSGAGLDQLTWNGGSRSLRAARRGPVPADPVERDQMAALVDQLIAARRRLLRWVTPLLLGLGLLQAVVLVLEPSVLRAANAVLPMVLVVLQQAEGRALRRRRAALAAG